MNLIICLFIEGGGPQSLSHFYKAEVQMTGLQKAW